MFKRLRNFALAATVAVVSASPAIAQANAGQKQKTAPMSVRHVVLVLGAFVDGAGWRNVYDDLTTRGYRVSIVQNPITSLEDDVAATVRILDEVLSGMSASMCNSANRSLPSGDVSSGQQSVSSMSGLSDQLVPLLNSARQYRGDAD